MDTLIESPLMSTLSERIDWLIKHFEISQSALANLAGVKQPSVASWLSGKTKNMKSGPALALCSKLPISQEWLVNGIGEPLRSDVEYPSSNSDPVCGNMRRIPVLSYSEAGAPNSSDIIQARHKAFENGDYIWVDKEHPDDCFGLRVIGRSMEPEFLEDDILVIDPTINPMPGDFVLASWQCRQSNVIEIIFKKYKSRGYDAIGNIRFDLISLNDDYPKYESEKEQLKITGILVEHRRSYRRKR